MRFKKGDLVTVSYSQKKDGNNQIIFDAKIKYFQSYYQDGAAFDSYLVEPLEPILHIPREAYKEISFIEVRTTTKNDLCCIQLGSGCWSVVKKDVLTKQNK